MASIRPARCYRRIHRPYTRVSSKKPRKSYVKGVPRPKIQQFNFGTKNPKLYSKVVYLVANQAVQVRSESLEAARTPVVQQLEKHLGKNPFFMRVRPYPHHVIRENPLATGAGADRFQQGMRQSFGNPIGSAAQLRVGQKIMEVWIGAAGVKIAKNALNAARYKLGTTCHIVVEDFDVAKELG